MDRASRGPTTPRCWRAAILAADLGADVVKIPFAGTMAEMTDVVGAPLDPSDDPPGLNTRIILDATTPVAPDTRGAPKHEVRSRPETARWTELLRGMLAGRQVDNPITPDDQAADHCPRCSSTTTDVVARSPKEGMWQMYRCTTCSYAWRSTETGELVPPQLRVSPGDATAALELT